MNIADAEVLLTGITDDVRSAMAIAGKFADASGHQYVDTVHLLVGILRAKRGVIHKAIEQVGISIDEVLADSEADVSRVTQRESSEPAMLPPIVRVLSSAMRQAHSLAQEKIGLEALVLGMLEEENCAAALILLKHGATMDALHRRILDIVHHN